jgi:GT2 family glycosyltransferase
VTHYILMPVYGHADLAVKALKSVTDTVHRTDIQILIKWLDYPLPPEGFTKATNDLFRIALADKNMESVTLVASDTEMLTTDWLTKCLDYAKLNPDVGIIAPQELLKSEQYRASLLPYSGEIMFPGEGTGKELVYAIFAVVFITKECLRKVGLLDEQFNPGSYDDFDYCLRAREEGFKTVWFAEMQYKHVRGATIGPLVEQGIYQYPSRQAKQFYEKWKHVTFEGEPVDKLLKRLENLRDKNYVLNLGSK